jgi:hypothetical protein
MRLVDFASLLTAAGIPVPSKIEGLAFGPDVMVGGTLEHTLYVGNDNDFTPDAAGLNQFFVVGLSDAQLAAFGVSYTPQAIAEPGSLALLLSASVGLLTGGHLRRIPRRIRLSTI